MKNKPSHFGKLELQGLETFDIQLHVIKLRFNFIMELIPLSFGLSYGFSCA